MAFFPHPLTSDENGILGIEGNLNPDTLLLAYHYGIFPWYNEYQPIVWWYPKERFVLFPDQIYVSKSMAKVFRNNSFHFSVNQAFSDIVDHCASTLRKDNQGTWINPNMRRAYNKLYLLGYGLSIEVRQNNELVGGLYGVSIGKIFYGESMFSRVTNASKAAFIYLALLLKSNGYQLIDCQQENPHLASLNAQFISEREFFDYNHDNRRNHMYEKINLQELSSSFLLEEVLLQRNKSLEILR